MSAAATAAGYLYASGRLRGGVKRQIAQQERQERQEEAERAAEHLRLEREAKEQNQRRKQR